MRREKEIIPERKKIIAKKERKKVRRKKERNRSEVRKKVNIKKQLSTLICRIYISQN